MEDEDHDELLQCTDDESLSESEDQCLPIDKPEETQTVQYLYTSHTKLEFLVIKCLLIISSTALVIILPMYLESMNSSGDAYSMINVNTTVVLLFLVIAVIIARQFCPTFKNIRVLKPPIGWIKIIAMSVMYTLSGFMVMYAIDRKRVMCHLQDPIKGVLLVFSLINYFFYCKKVMGLQRIFSTTTIIVGLFISVDYGLCDEFRCRGNEREHRADDAGAWNWQTHSIWAAVYISGLNMFATFFTLLDRYLISSDMITSANVSTNLLATVSRMVSFQNSVPHTRSVTAGSTACKNNVSSLHLAFYMHAIGWVVTTGLFWTDLIPTVGKGSNMTEFLQYFKNGIECHFSGEMTSPNFCGYVTLWGWLFMMFYVVFILCALRFLILCQSAVYTMAVATASLPLVGIWWSLFKVTTLEHGLIAWAPAVTGELICALLGFPIVIIGLTLLCKSHFKDCKQSSVNSTCLTSTHLA